MNREEGIFWDLIAKKSADRNPLLDAFQRYKKEEFKRLIYKWIGETNNLKILKTDLFEEGLDSDYILFDIFKQDTIFGMDISTAVTEKADTRSRIFKEDLHCSVGDVIRLPYKDSSFEIGRAHV